MTYPATTALYAALFGVLFVGLSFWVVAGRARHRVNHGDGGVDRLQRRIRAHANFAEYVPFILLVVGLLEGGGGGARLAHWLLAPLLLARLAHPVGMVAEEGAWQQFAFRGSSMMVTWLVLLAACALLLRSVV